MNGRTHLLSGLILGTVLCTKADMHAVYLGSCIAGTLFPDADHRKSIMGRFLPLWLVFRPHRKNALHSLVGLAATSLLWAVIMLSWLHAVFFAAGYLMHLCLDSLTKMGVPWLWPNRRMFSLMGIVGGIMELLALFILYAIVVTAISAM